MNSLTPGVAQTTIQALHICVLVVGRGSLSLYGSRKMKHQILITTSLALQLMLPVMAQESLGQSEWITPGSSGATSGAFAQSAHSDLVNSGLSGELSDTPHNAAFQEQAQLGQSQWMQPGQSVAAADMGQSPWVQPGQAAAPTAQLGQSGWMQPGQDTVASGQMGQSGWMQPGQAAAPAGQMGQSGWMQPKEDPGSSELSGMVRKSAASNSGGGGKLSALADSLGTALQMPMVMAGAARMMGYGFAPVYATPFGFAPAFGGFGSYMPMSRGAAWTGVGSYMAGRAIRGMINGR